jgi:hypothetical protein
MVTTEENEDGIGAEAETGAGAPTGDVRETTGDEVLIETKGIAAVILSADIAEIAIGVEAQIGETTDAMTGEATGETTDDREIGVGSGIVHVPGSTDDGALDRVLVEMTDVPLFKCCYLQDCSTDVHFL